MLGTPAGVKKPQPHIMALPATPVYRRLFEHVRKLKAALTAPNIREGEVLFETLQNYLESWPHELAKAQDDMPEPAKEIFQRHMDEATRFVTFVEDDEAEPDDRAWRTDALNAVLPKVDEALALDPFVVAVPGSSGEGEGPAAAGAGEGSGGKRRKTRKGKSRKGKSKHSRRARYSRRR